MPVRFGLHKGFLIFSAQILWLKTLINVLFSFGRAAEPEDTLYNWHVWMSILLSASVLPPPRPARGRPLGAGR